MKVFKIHIVFFFLGYFNFNFGQNFGEFASAIFINNCGSSQFYNTTGAGANCINPACGTVFNGTDFGSFNQNSAGFSLNGGEIKTWKNGSGNVCSARLNYLIYPTGSRPGSPVFTVMNLPFKCGCGGATFTDGLGPCGGNDQKWNVESNCVNLTTRAPGNYTLEIYYDYTGGNSPAACDVTQYINNSGNPTNFTATFSVVASGGSCTLLPIELSNFSGQCFENEKIVSWSTASETNSSHFYLESSKDGFIWDTLQKIQAAGFSSKNRDYSFLDTSRSNSLNYYRLTELDFDGQRRFNQTIPLNCKNRDNAFYSFPNPSSGYFSVYFQDNTHSGEYLLEIMDLNSKILYTEKMSIEKGINLIPIELKLSSGIYLIHFKDENGTKKVTKHIVY